ncbi:glycosyltransferase family 4 protein, partial [Patescibacteria group bacterium]|nr:glycosyltransferase family 4 protein [Patescibacteria group bacterium]
MKIYFITSKLNFVTAGSSIGEFDLMMRTLQKLGNNVTAVTIFSQINNMPEPLPYRVIEKHVTARDLIGIQHAVFKILNEYAQDADFLHIDGHAFLYAAGLYRRLGGKTPISAYFNRELICWPEAEGGHFIKNNFLATLKKKLRWLTEKYIGMFLANGIDLMLFTNPHLQNSYRRFGLKPENKSIIFGDPVDYKKLMVENNITEDLYIKRNKANEKLNIIYSSRMVPSKGFELLIEAFTKIKNKENFNLLLGGTGPLETKLKQMIKDLRLENYVQLPGWVSREKFFESLKEADIFIQPRWRTDLTSISLIEAMAFGIPSILPGGGGLEWNAKKSALYFKDNDAADLA